MKQVFLMYVVLLLGVTTYAQRSNMSSVDYNKDLVNPIMEDDVMFRKYVTRRINFKEKQNKGFANVYSHFSRELQDALKDPNSGIIPYSAGSVIENGEFKKDAAAAFSQAAIDFVKKKAKDASADPFDEKGNIRGGIDIPYGDWNIIDNQLESEALNYLRTLGCDDKTNSQVKTSTEQEAEDAYLHMVEEVVFDKRRSRMYINIIAFQLVSSCPGGGPQPGPFIKYQQVDKYFRKLYYDSKETKGMWFNERNVRRKMCVMDAFELRLFSSRIIKISNAEDKKLEEIYTDKMEELYKSQEAEMELMEFEHNLWEF